MPAKTVRADELTLGDRVEIPIDDVPHPGLLRGEIGRIEPPKWGVIHFVVNNKNGSAMIAMADYWLVRRLKKGLRPYRAGPLSRGKSA